MATFVLTPEIEAAIARAKGQTVLVDAPPELQAAEAATDVDVEAEYQAAVERGDDKAAKYWATFPAKEDSVESQPKSIEPEKAAETQPVQQTPALETKESFPYIPPIIWPPKKETDEFAMTPAEVEAELDRPFPVLLLKEKGGPDWDDDILYGIAGQITKKACQYNEAHPAGIYIDLLVTLGNIFGRHAYFNVNSTRHYTNEFMVRVGDSSVSRKGSGRDTVDEISRTVDPDWYRNRIKSGFGSGQAIVNEMRDESVQQVFNKRTKEFKEIKVPGVDDKRLCVRENEFVKICILVALRDSTASVVMRDGWDGKEVRVTVKGKTDGFSNSAICQEPHLSISADTTRGELRAKMPKGSDENGFGNRFLYPYVYRTKKCPLGGPPIDWTPEIAYLQKAVEFAKSQKYIPLSKAAEKMWGRMYIDVESNLPKGLAGSLTGRGPAHIRRLALILALLDLSNVVESHHLKAARRIWNYCQESVDYIFSSITGDQQKILDYVHAYEKTTVTRISENVFKQNKKISWVQAQVDELVKDGRLHQVLDEIRFNSAYDVA